MKRILGGIVGAGMGLVLSVLVVPLAGCPIGACAHKAIDNGTYQVTKGGSAFGSFVVASGKLIHTVTAGTDTYVMTYAASANP